MRQRHLTAETTELIARTSLVTQTGVGKCGSQTYTFRALSRHISFLALSEGELQAQVLTISFFTVWNLLRTLNLLLKC